MHSIAVLAYHGVLPFDLATPCEVFGRMTAPGHPEPYTVRVCGTARTVKAGAFDLRVPYGLADVAGAQTVVLPGIADPTAPIPRDVLSTVRDAAGRGARIASICTGAFVLAATGLLDGLRATTHWAAADMLAVRYPAVIVDPNVLFVDNGQILTSAGAAAGLDLCLYMVRRDYGHSAATQAARLAVMPLERDGGQAQFIAHQSPASAASLQPLLHWLSHNLHRTLDMEEVASQAAMAPRTLSRHFRQQVGTTLLQWLLAARVRRAQLLLETTGLSVEQVAAQAGFGLATMLRDRFAKSVGTTPTAYRRALGVGSELTGEQEQPAPAAPLRPRGLPAAQPDRAPDQPPQAVPPHCDPIREARRQLPRHGHAWHDSALVVTIVCRHALVAQRLPVHAAAFGRVLARLSLHDARDRQHPACRFGVSCPPGLTPQIIH